MRIDDMQFSAVAAAQRAAATERSSTRTATTAVPTAEVRAWNAPVPTPLLPVQTRPPLLQTSTVADIPQVCRVPPDTRTLALLAKDVYTDKAAPPAGWRVASQGDLDRLGIDRSVLENPESGFRARVYAEGSGSDLRYVVSFRGSQSRGDWIANGQQALGIQSDHYRRAMQIGQRLARAEGENVHITGHSLGGGLASAAALASGHNATTFQAAGLSKTSIDAANQIRVGEGLSAAPYVRAYHVRGEILSAIQDGGDRVAGGLAGFWLGGLGGSAAGAAAADAPPAYGTRITLDAVRPEGVHWWQDNPVARHGMDWVLAGL